MHILISDPVLIKTVMIKDFTHYMDRPVSKRPYELSILTIAVSFLPLFEICWCRHISRLWLRCL